MPCSSGDNHSQTIGAHHTKGQHGRAEEGAGIDAVRSLAQVG